MQCAKGDLTVVVRSDGDRGGIDKVEMIAIPKIGLDDPPAADQLAVRRRTHVGAASNFGNRTRL